MINEKIVAEPGVEYKSERDFTTLVCWQKARELKIFLYREIVPLLPKTEKFNLSEQIRRAAISCSANIAEGYGRYNYQESAQFYRIARGSLFELKDHLISCHDLGFIDDYLFENGIKLIEFTRMKLNAYINYIIKQKEIHNKNK